MGKGGNKMTDDIFEEFKTEERSRAISRLVKIISFEKWKQLSIRKKAAKIHGEQMKQKKTERNEIKFLNQGFKAHYQ